MLLWLMLMGENRVQGSKFDKNPLVSFLAPSWLGVVLYLLVSSTILILSNLTPIFNALNLNIIIPGGSLAELYNQQAERVSNLASQLLEGQIVTFLFWILVGCAAYIIVWILQNTLLNIRNDIAADLFSHPKGYSHSGYWGSVIAYKGFFAASLLVTVGFLVYVLRELYPNLERLFYIAIFDFRLPESLLQIISAILFGALVLYIIVLLIKFTTNSWRWIVSNF